MTCSDLWHAHPYSDVEVFPSSVAKENFFIAITWFGFHLSLVRRGVCRAIALVLKCFHCLELGNRDGG